MQTIDDFRGLRFERRLPSTISRGLIPYGLVLGLFILLWLALPDGVLFGALLLLLAALVWVASFGWRQALARLIDLLQRLEHL